jgi:ferredoxin-nitrite reductase
LERFDATPRLAGRTLTTAARADHVGVRPERRAGHVSVGLSVPVGRIGAEDLVELARLARRYGDGTVRTTVDQSVVLTGVAEQGLDALLDEPLLATCSPTPGPFVRGIATCTGSEFCRYAVVETKARAAALGRHLDEALGAELAVAGLSDRPLRIHVSGCSASCAQPQIADVGLRGAVAKSGDALVEAFDVGLGGRLGPDASFIDWVEGAVPAARLEDVLVDVARAFVHDRRGDESFTSFVRRHSRDELRALVGGAP